VAVLKAGEEGGKWKMENGKWKNGDAASPGRLEGPIGDF
jgi:hypothetical protein